MDCPFCDYWKIKKDRTIKENKNTFVILSNPRLMPCHLLVVPKRHVEKPSELNEEERKELFDTIIEFQDKILSNLSSGCDIKQNYRPFMKQGKLKVNHLHFHLLPREFKDELYQKSQIFETDLFKELSNEEREKLIKILKL